MMSNLASNPACSWGEMDTELWLLYMLPSQSTPVSQASQNSYKGRCYDFNFKGSRNGTRCGGKHLVIKGCRHSVPQQQGLIMGASPLIQPPPTYVSLPLGEGVTAKVEDIWELGCTTIKVSELWKCLQLYPQEDVALELGWGFETGFRIPYVGPRLRTISPNILSEVHHADDVQKKLSKEIEMGRISGPYKHVPISNMRISPIGVVPKSTQGWRLITHLTYPQANSVNDFLDPQACSVKYTSFDKVIEMIAKQGVNAKLAKIDIKSTLNQQGSTGFNRVVPSAKAFNRQFYDATCVLNNHTSSLE